MLADTRCPKCGGTVYTNSDHNGEWLECLQCGWHDEVGKGKPQNINDPESRRRKTARNG